MASSQDVANTAWKTLQLSSVKLRDNDQRRFFLALSGTLDANEEEEFVNFYLSDLQNIWYDSLTVGSVIKRAENLNRGLEADKSMLVQCVNSAIRVVSNPIRTESKAKSNERSPTVVKSELEEDEDDSLSLNIQIRIGTGSFRWKICATRIVDVTTLADTAFSLFIRPSLCALSLVISQRRTLLEVIDQQRKNMDELDLSLSALGDAAKNARKRFEAMRVALDNGVRSAQLLENEEFTPPFAAIVQDFGGETLSNNDVQSIFSALLRKRQRTAPETLSSRDLLRGRSSAASDQRPNFEKAPGLVAESGTATERCEDGTLTKRGRSSGGGAPSSAPGNASNTNFDVNMAMISKKASEASANSKKRDTKKRTIFH